MSSVSFKELNQATASNFEVKNKLPKEKEIDARIENLSAKLAKFYPTSLSKYSIVRLVQSAFIAITRIFYSTTIKNLKIEIEQAHKDKHQIRLASCFDGLKQGAEDMKALRLDRVLNKLNQAAKPTNNNKTFASVAKVACEYVDAASQACQFIQNTIASQLASVVSLGNKIIGWSIPRANNITLASGAKPAEPQSIQNTIARQQDNTGRLKHQIAEKQGQIGQLKYQIGRKQRKIGRLKDQIPSQSDPVVSLGNKIIGWSMPRANNITLASGAKTATPQLIQNKIAREQREIGRLQYQIAGKQGEVGRLKDQIVRHKVR